MVNGYALIASFFISRIVFQGVLLVWYVVPVLFNYDYETAIQEIGEIKVRWAQALMFLYFLLYLMNIFWFTKLI